MLIHENIDASKANSSIIKSSVFIQRFSDAFMKNSSTVKNLEKLLAHDN